MLWYIVGGLVVYLIYTRIWKPHKYWKSLGVPHTESWPVLGDMTKVALQKQSMTECILDVYKKYPHERYYGINLFLVPTLIIKDLELIKKLTIKDFDFFEDHRELIPEDVDPYINKLLFDLKGQKWRHMRAKLSPAFTGSKMRLMFTLINESSQNLTKFFLEKDNDLLEMEMRDMFTRYTNDVIASTAFGVKCDSLRERDNEFYKMGLNITNTGGWRTVIAFGYTMCPSILKFFKIPIFPKSVGDYFSDIIKEAMDIREKNDIIRPDLLHLLMKAREGNFIHEEVKDKFQDSGFAAVEESNTGKTDVVKEFSDEDLIAQALQFFFGGFDTSSLLLCFMSHELALNPDKQRKLQKEIDDTFQATDGKLTYDTLLSMKYLDMVVSETLRMWPPGFMLDRICVKPYTIEPERPTEKSLDIEPKTVIMVPVIGIHRDPKYFPNPLKFDPERFSDENKNNIVPGSYMPFGSGPRNCIASRFALLEVKTLFFHLLHKFNIEVIGKTQVPLVLKKSKIDIDAENGFWLGLKAR